MKNIDFDAKASTPPTFNEPPSDNITGQVRAPLKEQIALLAFDHNSARPVRSRQDRCR